MADEPAQAAQVDEADTLVATAPAGDQVVDDGYFRVSKSNPWADVARLAGQDPEFSRAVQRFGGHRERRELERLRAELDTERAERRKSIIESMDDEAINERLRSDPNFARAYHERDAAPPAASRDALEFRAVVEDALDAALVAGVPKAEVEKLQEAIASGVFDRDAEGNPVSAPRGLALIQATVDAMAQKARQPRQAAPARPAPAPTAATPEPTPQPAARSNPSLASARPDTSPAGSPASGVKRYKGYLDWAAAVQKGEVAWTRADSAHYSKLPDYPS